ncbi:MAG: LysM peptidoglycan-binding domain-containing protein [Bacteroidales bacterium]
MRKFRKNLLATLLGLCITAISLGQTGNYETTTVDGKEFYIYTVSHAEGFYALTRQFNVSQNEIELYNPETKAGLKKGQRILIPVKTTAAPKKNEEANFFVHTVQPGETLSALARTYNVSVSDIAAINPGMDKNLVIGHAVRIPQAATIYRSTDHDYIFHTIEPKETLFSVSRHYGVKMQDIMNENPGLNENTFAIGKVIRIKADQQAELASEAVSATPVSTYKVKKKETLYSISRKFDVTLTELLELNPGISRVKAGDLINIPGQDSNNQEFLENNSETIQQMQDILKESTEIKKSDRISVVLLLPFQLYYNTVNSSLRNRYIEFYEGFLMAVDSLKSQGASFDIYVFDTDSKQMADILAKPEVKNASLIIGPADNTKISEVVKFAEANDINVVNPFTFDSDAAETSPHLFQLNTPNSYLYAESSMEFANIFKDNTIVFLKETGSEDDKKDFIDYLRRELERRQIAYVDYEFTGTEELTEMDSILNLNGPVVFVPLSAKKNMLGMILPTLSVMKKNTPNIQISLFGYPEWQTYTKEYMDYFYELNTYIYTRIYVNPFSKESKEFLHQFKYWYNKELLPVYPKYGILGFDTGMFFLTAVEKYGKNFDSHIDMIPAESIQTAMCFRRINNWSGFINRCIYFVNFRPDNTIQKIEVK